MIANHVGPSLYVCIFSLTCKKLFHTKAEGIYHYVTHAVTIHRLPLTTAFDPKDHEYERTLLAVYDFIKDA